MGITFGGVLFFLAITTAITFLSFVIVRKIPFYKKAVEANGDGRRFETIDGLRGFLALGVFFQHAATNYVYFQTGLWHIVDSRFYRHLGGEAVILFFIITGFLYWSKAIEKKGTVSAKSLYRSRFFRLAPMYIISAVVVMWFALVQSGFHVDWFLTMKDTLSWLTLGLATPTSWNGVNILPINAGIHWTLHFEWFFYLLLPILALSIKNKKMLLMVIPIGIYALTSEYRGYWEIFFFGIVAAHIVKKYPTVGFFSKKISSLVPIVGIIAIYFIQYKPYSHIQYVLSLCVFLSILYGADFFGVLRTQVAKFLGTISYSMYLIHGIVIFLVLNSIDYFYPVSLLGFSAYWFVMLVAGLFAVVISSLTYRYIEYPMLQKIKIQKKEKENIGIALEDKVM